MGSSRVQHTHAIESAQVHVGTAVLHQKLGQVQVALLAGQVERGGPAACPPVHTAVGEGEVQRVFGGGCRRQGLPQLKAQIKGMGGPALGWSVCAQPPLTG